MQVSRFTPHFVFRSVTLQQQRLIRTKLQEYRLKVCRANQHGQLIGIQSVHKEAQILSGQDVAARQQHSNPFQAFSRTGNGVT